MSTFEEPIRLGYCLGFGVESASQRNAHKGSIVKSTFICLLDQACLLRSFRVLRSIGEQTDKGPNEMGAAGYDDGLACASRLFHISHSLKLPT